MSLIERLENLASRIAQEIKSVKSNYLLATNYSANDVLNKVKTVHGSNSGLDADLLDGKHASELQICGVNSNSLYSDNVVSDANNATKTGFYYFTGATNGPVVKYGHLHVTTSWPNTWINQLLFIQEDGAFGKTYIRKKINGTWGAWFRILDGFNDIPLTDGSVSYARVSGPLKQKGTVTASVDLSANGIGEITLSANTAFAFTGFEVNKSYLLIIVANGFTPSWAAAAKHIAVEGNASFANTGTFYVSLTCIDATSGSEKLLTVIMKGA